MRLILDKKHLFYARKNYTNQASDNFVRKNDFYEIDWQNCLLCKFKIKKISKLLQKYLKILFFL